MKEKKIHKFYLKTKRKFLKLKIIKLKFQNALYALYKRIDIIF